MPGLNGSCSAALQPKGTCEETAIKSAIKEGERVNNPALEFKSRNQGDGGKSTREEVRASSRATRQVCVAEE